MPSRSRSHTVLVLIVLSMLPRLPATAQGRVELPTTEIAWSPDRRMVAFVREPIGAYVGDTVDHYSATELWVARRDGSRARVVLRAQWDVSPRALLARFHSPVFSADGRRVYFLSAAWYTSSAVHVVDLRSGKERYVLDGNAVEVIRCGPHTGRLLITRHRSYDKDAGSYDPVWMTDANGKGGVELFSDDFKGRGSAYGRWRRKWRVDAVGGRDCAP